MNGTILGLTREEVDARYEDIVAFADIGQFVDQPLKTSRHMESSGRFSGAQCLSPVPGITPWAWVP